MMDYSKSTTLFLLILHDTSYNMGYITAKIFDYMALRKPILGIGKKNSIADNVLKQTKSGELFEENEIKKISKFIESKFELWIKNRSLLLGSNLELMKYSTQKNVEKLSHIFNQVSQ